MTDQTEPTRPAMTMREIREALGHNVNPQPETESARALLYRHGLPEDVIDGALCLHAQELAALQRLRMDELDLAGQKARVVGRIVDLIDPTRAAEPAVVSAPVQPTTRADDERCICGHTEQQHFEDVCLTCDCGDYLTPEGAREVIARWRQAAGKSRADVLREAAARLEASARKWDGLSSSAYDEEAHTAKELRAEAAELRRMAGEEQPATETPSMQLARQSVQAMVDTITGQRATDAVVARQDGATT